MLTLECRQNLGVASFPPSVRPQPQAFASTPHPALAVQSSRGLAGASEVLLRQTSDRPVACSLIVGAQRRSDLLQL